jgi:predicted PurR-regulated permease PerM
MIAQPRETRALRALLLPMTILAWLAVMVVAAWLLGHVAHALLILVLATLIAFALGPVVSFFSHWMPQRSRSLTSSPSASSSGSWALSPSQPPRRR